MFFISSYKWDVSWSCPLLLLYMHLYSSSKERKIHLERTAPLLQVRLVSAWRLQSKVEKCWESYKMKLKSHKKWKLREIPNILKSFSPIRWLLHSLFCQWETTSLSLWGRGKIWSYSTLSRPYVCDCTGNIVVVVFILKKDKHIFKGKKVHLTLSSGLNLFTNTSEMGALLNEFKLNQLVI